MVDAFSTGFLEGLSTATRHPTLLFGVALVGLPACKEAGSSFPHLLSLIVSEVLLPELVFHRLFLSTNVFNKFAFSAELGWKHIKSGVFQSIGRLWFYIGSAYWMDALIDFRCMRE